MTHQVSFTKNENELLPGYRQRLNTAESTEDVRKFFAYSIQELLRQIFPEAPEMDFEDIELIPEGHPPYRLSQRVLSHPQVGTVWSASDLPQVIGRFAEAAQHRYTHLAKNPQRTEQKIRMER